jgi:Zn-dependent protease with chaperone function
MEEIRSKIKKAFSGPLPAFKYWLATAGVLVYLAIYYKNWNILWWLGVSLFFSIDFFSFSLGIIINCWIYLFYRGLVGLNYIEALVVAGIGLYELVRVAIRKCENKLKDEDLEGRITMIANKLQVKGKPILGIMEDVMGVNAGGISLEGVEYLEFTREFFNMNKEQQNAIIAHELTHIKNADTIRSFIGYIAVWGMIGILALNVLILKIYAFSKVLEVTFVGLIMGFARTYMMFRQEYLADLGAKIAGYGDALCEMFKERIARIAYIWGHSKRKILDVLNTGRDFIHPSVMDRFLYLKGLSDGSIPMLWTGRYKQLDRLKELGVISYGNTGPGSANVCTNKS